MAMTSSAVTTAVLQSASRTSTGDRRLKSSPSGSRVRPSPCASSEPLTARSLDGSREREQHAIVKPSRTCATHQAAVA